MKLTKIAGGSCGRDDCPTISATDRETLAIQGYKLDMQAPEGEAIVEVPMEVFQEAARALGR